MSEPRPQDGPAPDAVMRCADCARSESAATDLVPVDHMPIPAEALAGFPDGVPRERRHTRRSFLRSGLVGVAAVYAASRIPWTQAFEAAVAEAAVDSPALVVVFLNGGNDGMQTLVPVESAQYAEYQRLRPRLARAIGPSTAGRVGTTPLTNSPGLAWANVCVSGTANNGDTKGFDTLYGDGSGGAGSDMALFPAADYTPPNLSHFDSRDYWFAGALQKLTTGWLGRWLDLYGSPSNPLQAVSVGSGLSKQLRSQRAPTAAIASLTGAGFRVDGVSSREADVNGEVGNLAAVPVAPGNLGLAAARGNYGMTVQVARQLGALTPGAAAPGYPASSLSDRLRMAAVLLSSGLGTRIVTIDWGSLDTHGGQLPSQDPQLSTLSRALAAFQEDLRARGIEGRVMTLVFSEFGRRIPENGSAGTDHGAGGLMWCQGPMVRGGVAGEFPGITSLDRGNLIVRTDFRGVYSSIVGEWLGGDPGAVLPGGPFPLGRADGHASLLK